MKKALIRNAVPVTEDFLGNNAVYHGYAGISDDSGREYTEQECELEADRAAALGLKIARTYYLWYAYDKENKCWNWDLPDMKAFIRWCERLKARGIDVALGAGWCCPGDFFGESFHGTSPFLVEGDYEKSVENYAWWISETVHQLVEVRGLTNVKYLIMFTEPQGGGTEDIIAGKNRYEHWYNATKAVSDRLIADGRRHLVKMVGPNEGSTIDPVMMKWIKEKDPGLLDIYTCHNYLGYRAIYPDHDGAGAITKRGGRFQQYVDLKPNTEYEIKVSLATDSPDILSINGYVQYGFFDTKSEERRIFEAGRTRTTRLYVGSTEMVDAGNLAHEMKEFSFTTKTGDDVEGAAFGVFGDIFQKGSFLVFKNASVKEVGSDTELLKNVDFKEGLDNWRTICASIYGYGAYRCWKGWVEKALSYLDKEDDFWYDEYNTSGKIIGDYHEPNHGVELAVARIAFMNCGAKSNLMWTLFDQQWPRNHTQQDWHRFFDGDHRYGVMPVLKRSLVPYPSYYALQLTGYVGGGEGVKVYSGEGEDNFNCTLTTQPDGTITLLGANDNPTQQEVEMEFEIPVNCKMYRYLYNPETIAPDENATPIPADRVIEVEGKIKDVLPAYSVVVYTNKER